MLKYTTMFRLLNGSILGNIAFAPVDEGGSGAGNGGTEGVESGDGSDGTDQKGQTSQGADGGDEDAGDAALASLADALGKNLNPQPKAQTPEDIKHTREALQKEMVSAISAFSVPKDFIPEGFDPANPQSMSEVFNNFGQQVIMAALPILMKPVQTALAAMDGDVNRRIREGIDGFQGKTNIEKQLADVPGWNHPSVGPLLQQSMAVLKAEGKKDAEIVSSIKAMASRFNVADTKKPSGGSEKDILDALFDS